MLRYSRTRRSNGSYGDRGSSSRSNGSTRSSTRGREFRSGSGDASSESENVETPRDLDVGTIREAIQESDFACLKRLLEAGAPIGDNLFYAIYQGSLNAVKIICGYYQLKGSRRLYHVVNTFPQGSDYLPTATPLQIAAKCNDLEMVKVLLRYGAVMPKLDQCLEQVGSDVIVRSLVFLLYMRAACSPALLVAKETNPVGRALRLAMTLKDNTFINETHGWMVNHQSFNDGLREIRDTLESFLCHILDRCKNRSEVDVILEIQANHRFDEELENSDGPLLLPKKLHSSRWEDSVLPTGLEQAISLKFKKYVSHPYAQMILLERALDGPVEWEKMSSARFTVISFLLVLMSPFLCLAYALVPVSKLVRFIETPYVRILNTFSSHLFFMTFLLLTTLNLKYRPFSTGDDSAGILFPTGNFTGHVVEHQYWPIGYRLVGLAFIVLGEILWLLYNLYRMGIRMFSRQVWNWINIIQTLFFFISLAAYLILYVKTQRYLLLYENSSDASENIMMSKFLTNGTHIFEYSRESWSVLDPVLIAELSFSIGNCLTVMRLLYTFTLVDFLGPLVIAMSRMFATLARFVIITVLVLVSFALGLTQLFAPYQSLPHCEKGENEDFCGNAEMFSSFKSSILTLFWAIFGDFKITDLELPANLQLVTNSAHVIHAIFLILMTIAVLNILIATVIGVYESIQGNIDMEWKFARTKMLEEYLGRRANLPPPYNLIPSVRFIKHILSTLCGYAHRMARRVRSKVMANGRVPQYNWPRRYQLPSQDEEGDTRQVIFKGKHKVLKTVVGRYVNKTFPGHSSHPMEREGNPTQRSSETNGSTRRKRSITVFNMHAFRRSSTRSSRKGSGQSADSEVAPYCFKPISEQDEHGNFLTIPAFDTEDSTDSTILTVPQIPLQRMRSISMDALGNPPLKRRSTSMTLV